MGGGMGGGSLGFEFARLGGGMDIRGEHRVVKLMK
jgi:hypothetical protein